MHYSVFRYWGIQTVAIVTTLVALLAVARFMPEPAWVRASVLSAVAVAGISFAFLAYRFADEIILQTHKTAWFWGSMAGMTLFVPIWFFVGEQVVTVPLLFPRAGDVRIAYFMEGALLVVVMQCAAFLLVLAWLRLLRIRH